MAKQALGRCRDFPDRSPSRLEYWRQPRRGSGDKLQAASRPNLNLSSPRQRHTAQVPSPILARLALPPGEAAPSLPLAVSRKTGAFVEASYRRPGSAGPPTPLEWAAKKLRYRQQMQRPFSPPALFSAIIRATFFQFSARQSFCPSHACSPR